ncbi:MAG TPA: hypothetical protein VGD60_00185 [Candidatus Acidoferrales bacterium]
MDTYKQALETAQHEMAELLERRKAIDKRLIALAPLVDQLSRICNPMPPPDLNMPGSLDIGLTDAIQLAFKSGGAFGLTALEVRDHLKAQGFNLDKYASELPPIHNTIARLEKAGKLETFQRPGGVKAHKWVSSLLRAVREMDPVPAPSPIIEQASEAFFRSLGIPSDNEKAPLSGYHRTKK